jgi:hypothetical protein
MITEIDPALAHVYRRGQHRLLISMEITTWEARRTSGEAFPGESCVFFSEDGGKSWTELYLLSMTGDRCAKFSALVLNLEHETTSMVKGAGGELKYVGHHYELVTDERTNFRDVTRLTDVDRLRISNVIKVYRQV